MVRKMSNFEKAWKVVKRKRVDERRKRGGIAPDVDNLEGAKRSLGSDVLEGHRFSHLAEDTSERDSAHWLDQPFHSRSYEPMFHDDDDVYEEEAARYEDRGRKKAMRRGIKDPRQARRENERARVNPSSGRPGMTPLPKKPRTFKEILAARSAKRREGGSTDEPDF